MTDRVSLPKLVGRFSDEAMDRNLERMLEFETIGIRTDIRL
jgi:hypothetical protein